MSEIMNHCIIKLCLFNLQVFHINFNAFTQKQHVYIDLESTCLLNVYIGIDILDKNL